MDALKSGVSAFTDVIITVECPVLLAIVCSKVNLKTEGNEFVRGSISPIAAVMLEIGVIMFLVSKGTADGLLITASKVLAHLSALLLMALAYGVLLLISTNLLYLFCLLIPFSAITVWRCYRSVAGDVPHANAYDGHTEMLENLVEFSAAVTSILSLGLKGMALEWQSSSTAVSQGGLDPHLLAASGLSFATCVFGVFVMLLGTVPPLTNDAGHGTDIVEAMNIVLAVFMGGTVYLITSAAVKELASLVLVPLLVALMTWAWRLLDFNGHVIEEEFVKPVSLNMSKVTSTGFLAVSVLAVGGKSSPSSDERAFIVLTAAAVILALAWRLLTHRTTNSRDVVDAANIAGFCTHLCVAAAVVPFAKMAAEALK